MNLVGSDKGKGKYDDACEALFKATEAQCAIAIVFEGKEGGGFSMTANSPKWQTLLPSILRETADNIEKQNMVERQASDQPAG